MFWQYYHMIENSALPKTLLFLAYVGVIRSCHILLLFTHPQQTLHKSDCNTVSFVVNIFLKHLIPELWNTDKSTLTWLTYFLSCFSLNTYSSPVYQRQMATAFWYTEYLLSHVVCFWSIFLPFPSNELTHPSFIYSCF